MKRSQIFVAAKIKQRNLKRDRGNVIVYQLDGSRRASGCIVLRSSAFSHKIALKLDRRISLSCAVIASLKLITQKFTGFSTN